MELNLYDVVKLNSGQEATILEKFSNGDFLVDGSEDVPFLVKLSEIIEVTWKYSAEKKRELARA
ncbi:MAG: hypothetical protein LBV19_09730 [Streptococcaceae bacterium]|jgi:hypothetical protein|nr:hypothetical protein [Streptococcaceae bacterium]